MKKKTYDPPAKIKIKKGDVVKVLAGKSRGKTGRVLEVDRDRGRVLVEGVALIKRHAKPNPARQTKGGIAEREAFIHVSNVAATTSGGVATRVGYRVETSASGVVRKTRVSRKTNEILDKK